MRAVNLRESVVGLISFVKNVGASIFGGSEAKAAPVEELKKALEKHGLDSKDVKIEVDGDKVKVSGTTSSSEQAEKIAVALGNTVGVQAVQNDIKPAKVEPDSNFYTVKSGDTLWAIAEREYGKGHGPKYDVIFQANRPMLTHPDKIYPGQVLRIPALK
jgi:nucleoid-associated protein YgaU